MHASNVVPEQNCAIKRSSLRDVSKVNHLTSIKDKGALVADLHDGIFEPCSNSRPHVSCPFNKVKAQNHTNNRRDSPFFVQPSPCRHKRVTQVAGRRKIVSPFASFPCYVGARRNTRNRLYGIEWWLAALSHLQHVHH